MSHEPGLSVFVSSSMAEFEDLRPFIRQALEGKGLQAVLVEETAYPTSPETASLAELEEADLYVGIFGQQYGAVTIKEYEAASKLDKPCLLYVRDLPPSRPREPALSDFINNELSRAGARHTYSRFSESSELAARIADDVNAWLVRRYRELSAAKKYEPVSRDELDRFERELTRLERLTSDTLEPGGVADHLATQLRRWFIVLDYTMEKDTEGTGATERTVDLIIQIPRRGHRYDRVLVRAQEGMIEVADVDALVGAGADQFDEAWLISSRRISPAARDHAEKKPKILVYTLDELLEEDVSWDPYFAWVETEYEQRQIERYYVPVSATMNDVDASGRTLGTSYYDDVAEYVRPWLEDPSREHVSILGEFGTGKTWFSIAYAYEMVSAYRQAQRLRRERPRIPLVIQLRNYAQGFKDVESLLSEFVFREHEIGLPNFRAFQELNRMGRLLLIFDGFDEMAARVDRQKMVNNFWELARILGPGAKAILTCRTEHFQYASQALKILRGELRASTAAIVLEAPRFEVVHLEMLSDEKLHEVLLRRGGDEIANAVMGRPPLVQIARRPVLVEFLLEALPSLDPSGPIDLSQVYYHATREKMERDIGEHRTFTSLADKLFFLCELSWEMLATDQMSFHYRSFPDRIRKYFGPKVADTEEDHWQFDLLAQTMLVRDADGNYRPAHRSLLEFFAAYKLVCEMGALRNEYLGVPRKQSAIDPNSEPRCFKWSEYFRRERDSRGELLPIAPLSDFEPETLDVLVHTLGSAHLVEAIATLMGDLVNPDRLIDIVKSTKGASVRAAGFVGVNALELAVRCSTDLRDADLTECFLNEVHLSTADLSGISLAGASLAGSRLYGCDFRRASLKEITLSGTALQGCDLSSADLNGSDLRGVSFSGINLENADFRRVIAKDAQWSDPTITALSFTADDRFLAIACDDGGIRCYNRETGHLEASLQTEPGSITQLTHCAARTDLVAEVNVDRATICVWNLSTLKRVAECKMPDVRPRDRNQMHCEFLPDGRCIAIGAGGQTHVWSVDTDSPLWDHKRECEFHAVLDQDSLLVREHSGGFAAIDAETGEQIHAHPLRSKSQGSVRPVGSDFLQESAQGVVKLLDRRDGSTVFTKHLGSSEKSLTFSPAGKLWAMYSALSSSGAELNLRRVDGGETILMTDHPNMFGQSGDHLFLVEPAFSHDEKVLASRAANSRAFLWDTEVGSPSFGQLIHTIVLQTRCEGLKLRGASGLSESMHSFLKTRGALLK